MEQNQSELQSLTEKCANSSEETVSLNNQLTTATNQVEELTAMLKESEKETADFKERMASLNSEVESLNEQLTAYAGQLKNTREEQEKNKNILLEVNDFIVFYLFYHGII